MGCTIGIFCTIGTKNQARYVPIHSHGAMKLTNSTFNLQTGSNLLAQANNANGQRPRDRPHRNSQQQLSTTAIPSPSPALVRNGSKQHRPPAALVPGGTSSAAAQVGIAAPSPSRRGSGQIQQQQQQQHPYANSTGAVQEYSRDGNGTPDESFANGGYGARSSAVGMPTTPGVNSVSRTREEAATTSGGGNVHGTFQGQDEPRKRGLFASLCHCG